MAKRPAQRLGIGGEQVPPGPNPRAQHLFLEAVRKHVPEALSDLAKRIEKHISEAISRGAETIEPELRKHPPEFTRVIIVDRLRRQRGSDDLERIVRDWCKQKHFTVAPDGDYLVDVVRHTGARMRRELLGDQPRGIEVPVSKLRWKTPKKNEKPPKRTATPQWEYPLASYLKPLTAITPPSYEPWRETRAQFRERVEMYATAVEAATGWTELPENRQPLHFEWLALYQVGQLTQPQIVERYQDSNGRPEVPAVSRALSKTAQLVGLILRSR